MWTERTDHEIEIWIVAAIDPGGGAVPHFYREQEKNIDQDIAKAASRIKSGQEKGSADWRAAAYTLRMLWRYALRRYSLGAAWAIHRQLRRLKEPLLWQVWRWKDVLLLRLAVGVIAGFVALTGCGSLVDALYVAGPMGYFYGILGACAVVILAMATADVQRQIGRRSWRAIAMRALYVTGVGCFYGGIGGLIQWAGGRALGMWVFPRAVILTSAAAVVLGFVFQLFWQDRSIGDPL
jgi:hypothetical protein